MEHTPATQTHDKHQGGDSFLRLSASIACMRFPLAVSIIIYHSHTIVTIPDKPLYFELTYPFALWIGETGVPAFFFIAGLWFFYSAKSYQTKIKDRIRTLVIPYFLWNSLLLAAFVIALLLGFNLLINQSKYIADYGVVDYLRAYWDCGDWSWGNGKPVYPPMWFVRNLFLLCLLSPLFKVVIKATGVLLPLAACLFWLLFPGFWLSIESVAAFTLGAYFPLRNVSLMDLLDKYRSYFVVALLLFGLADILTNTILPVPFNLQIHRLAVLTNILTIPLVGQLFLSRNMPMKSLSKMAFFIYCVHLPLVALFRKPVLQFPELSEGAHIVLYLLTVVAVTFMTVWLYQLTRRLLPSFLKLATGNRE